MPVQPTSAASSASEPLELTREERKSLTHGEFWIPGAERRIYRLALERLNRAGIPFVVSGLYAIYEYAGIYRQTKDLDLLFEPSFIVPAARVLSEAGFEVRLRQAHWVAKARRERATIDLIFGMGNGLDVIDHAWYRNSRPGILAATPVRIAPPEELIWHRLFIWERHRSDAADIVHLLLTRGDELDWERLLERTAAHWPLLLMQIHLFDYVYPGHTGRIPPWVREELYERAYEDMRRPGETDICRGTLVSRFSFAIDVNEWGFADPRERAIAEILQRPAIRRIRESRVWDS